MGKKFLLLFFTSIFLIAATTPFIWTTSVFADNKLVNIAHRGGALLCSGAHDTFL